MIKANDNCLDGVIVFGELDDFVPLGIAILWLGCRGEKTSTSKIVADGLDEIGSSFLFKALAQGRISATGRQLSGRRLAIPPSDWIDATLSPDDDDNLVSLDDPVKPRGERDRPGREFGGSMRGVDRSILWHDIKISREDMQTLAPDCWAKLHMRESKAPRKKYDQADVDQYFNELKQAWLKDPSQGPLTCRAWERTVARANFPGISKSQCRQAWGRLAPPGWRVRGRPRK